MVLIGDCVPRHGSLKDYFYPSTLDSLSGSKVPKKKTLFSPRTEKPGRPGSGGKNASPATP